MSDVELDALILSIAMVKWLKVARVIGETSERLEDAGVVPDLDRIHQRIAALAGAGALDGQGDLSRWRYGEIRLPAARST